MPAVDRDNVIITESAVARNALQRIIFVSRNLRRVGFQFYRPASTVAAELPNGATGQLLVKRKGWVTGDALARALSWTKEGAGANAIYWFTLDLFGTALSNAFGTNEVLEDLVLELTYDDGTGAQTPPRIPCTIYNRYLQGDEGIPEESIPDYPLPDNILTISAQELTTEQKAQVLDNLGLSGLLGWNPLEGPVDFETEGALGDYWFDPDTGRLWYYVAGQFRYTNFISE